VSYISAICDPKTPVDEVTVMLEVIDDGRLEAWPVSDAAKSSKSKGEQLIEPIGPKI
jgi:putative SOS response-associated peptidase YedK